VPDYCSDPVSPRGLQLLNAHSKQPRGVISDFDFLLANFFISQSNPLLQGKKKAPKLLCRGHSYKPRALFLAPTDRLAID
jgi:hypothetical protein